ncbi:PadR family transcriptional regulator [Streptomyces sp. NPDC048385]|uniref:PadR family transcriptional regulator n=1 Tax=Streptomyces sp. NPDC048385 TaxID=3155145 RepID=UPI00342D921A
MKLESILLGVLARHPSTGYDLKKFLDMHGRFMRSNTQMSQVYRSLGKMESRGWVSHTVQERAGATDAKTYRITHEGLTVFLDWLTGPYSPPTRFQDPDLGVRLAFAGFMSREQLLHLLDVELTTRREEVARYRFRDRSPIGTAVDDHATFDEDLATLVSEWAHEGGAQAMDAYLEHLELLRRVVLDAPEGTAGSELISRLHDIR